MVSYTHQSDRPGLAPSICGEAVRSQQQRDMEMLAFLDQERQLHNRKEGIGWAVVCTSIELQLPNARSRRAVWLVVLLGIIPDYIV